MARNVTLIEFFGETYKRPLFGFIEKIGSSPLDMEQLIDTAIGNHKHTRLGGEPIYNAYRRSKSWEELDDARMQEGVTLCCLIPDIYTERDAIQSLFVPTKRNYFHYFSPHHQQMQAPSYLVPKTMQKCNDQASHGFRFKKNPYEYQDTMLLVQYDPVLDRILSVLDKKSQDRNDVFHHALKHLFVRVNL